MPLIGQHPISWSKTGIIAYSNPNSKDSNLCITFLETVNGTNWRFHPPQKYILHPQLHEDQFSIDEIKKNQTPAANNTTTNNMPSNKNHTTNGTNNNTPGVQQQSGKQPAPQFFYNISSIHWSNWFSLIGDMLAVCDELGNMTMLIAGQGPDGATTFDKLTMLFQDNVYKIYNHVMPLHQSTPSIVSRLERKQTKKEYNTTILDFHWLSSTKSVVSAQFCALDNASNTYRTKAQQIPPYGIFHPPFMKYACLAIRKNGQIDFWYQFSNSKDHKKITLQLTNSENSRTKELDWLQFAKLTSINEDQSMLISTYSKLTQKVSFYKLQVGWNVNTAKPSVLNDPTLQIHQVLETTIDQLDSAGNVLELINLHVVSKSPLEKDSSPEVLLIYLISGTKKTLIKRFRLVQTQLSYDFVSTLKPNWKQPPGENVTQLLKSTRYNLQHHTDIKLENKAIYVTSEMLDGFVTFYFEDGSIASFNQNDWKLETERLIYQPQQGKYSNIITSTLSANFQYPGIPNVSTLEWIRVSPSLSGVLFKQIGKVTPDFLPIIQSNVADPTKDEVNATALAFGFVVSTHRQLANEDFSIACKTHILKILQLDEDRAKKFITTLMTRLFTFFNIVPDAPKEILDKIISLRSMQKVWLLQLELGNCFERSSIDEMARSIFYLKNVLFAFNGVSRNLHLAIEQMSNDSSIQQNSGKLFHKAFSKQDLIYSLIPAVKWFVKFITYLIQEMLILINNPPTKPNTLVIGILCAKIPRVMILSVMDEIKKIIQIISKFPENSYPILNESSHFLKLVLDDSPVNFEKFETFLVDVNNKFTTFSEQQPSQGREPSLLVNAEIPLDSIKMYDFLLTYSNNAVISHVDAAEIYFCDTSGLRISNMEIFQENVFHLLQPFEKGLILDMEDSALKSRKFSRILYDGITCDQLSVEELSDGKLKRCRRCGSVTRAGYVVGKNKTIVATNTQTRRWPTMYTRNCICS